jgi:hypothetical protein
LLGTAALAESGLAEFPGAIAPIIPQVGRETRELVFVIEIEMVAVGGVGSVDIPGEGGEIEFGGQDVEFGGELLEF